MIGHLSIQRIIRDTTINILLIPYTVIAIRCMLGMATLPAGIACIVMSMGFLAADQNPVTGVSKLRTGCRLHNARLDVAVFLVIRVLAPEHNRDLSGVVRLPKRLVGLVPGGHFVGQSHNSRSVLRPPLKGIPSLGGRTHIINDGRAVAGVDGLHAVAAVQVEQHQTVDAVIIDLHHGAAVGGDGGLLIQQRIEALRVILGVIVFVPSHLGHVGVGQALPGLPPYLRILVVVHVLLIVDDGVVHVGGLVDHGDGNVLADALIVQINGVLPRIVYIGQIALHDREGDRSAEAAARGQAGGVGVGYDLVILKHIVDDHIVGRRGRRLIRQKHPLQGITMDHRGAVVHCAGLLVGGILPFRRRLLGRRRGLGFLGGRGGLRLLGRRRGLGFLGGRGGLGFLGFLGGRGGLGFLGFLGGLGFLHRLLRQLDHGRLSHDGHHRLLGQLNDGGLGHGDHHRLAQDGLPADDTAAAHIGLAVLVQQVGHHRVAQITLRLGLAKDIHPQLRGFHHPDLPLIGLGVRRVCREDRLFVFRQLDRLDRVLLQHQGERTHIRLEPRLEGVGRDHARKQTQAQRQRQNSFFHPKSHLFSGRHAAAGQPCTSRTVPPAGIGLFFTCTAWASMSMATVQF